MAKKNKVIMSSSTRNWAYAAIYITILLGVALIISQCIIPWIADQIPVKPFIWIKEKLSFILGLAGSTLLGFSLYPHVDRSSKLKVTRVYTNRVFYRKRYICYGIGWHLGNILEMFAGTFKKFTEKHIITKEDPLGAKAVDDVVRVSGVLVLKAKNPRRVLQYGITQEEILGNAKPIILQDILSLIEKFTSDKYVEQILGKNLELTDYVNPGIKLRKKLRKSGFKIIWATGNIDESKEAEDARKRLRASQTLGQSITNVQGDGADKLDRADASAIWLVDQDNKNASFKRDELHIKTDHPDTLRDLRGTGILIGATHEHGEEH